MYPLILFKLKLKTTSLFLPVISLKNLNIEKYWSCSSLKITIAALQNQVSTSLRYQFTCLYLLYTFTNNCLFCCHWPSLSHRGDMYALFPSLIHYALIYLYIQVTWIRNVYINIYIYNPLCICIKIYMVPIERSRRTPALIKS